MIDLTKKISMLKLIHNHAGGRHPDPKIRAGVRVGVWDDPMRFSSSSGKTKR